MTLVSDPFFGADMTIPPEDTRQMLDAMGFLADQAGGYPTVEAELRRLMDQLRDVASRPTPYEATPEFAQELIAEIDAQIARMEAIEREHTPPAPAAEPEFVPWNGDAISAAMLPWLGLSPLAPAAAPPPPPPPPATAAAGTSSPKPAVAPVKRPPKPVSTKNVPGLDDFGTLHDF